MTVTFALPISAPVRLLCCTPRSPPRMSLAFAVIRSAELPFSRVPACVVAETVRTVQLVAAVRLHLFGLLMDPLSNEHLLLCCFLIDRVYRLSLADGTLVTVAGGGQ